LYKEGHPKNAEGCLKVCNMDKNGYDRESLVTYTCTSTKAFILTVPQLQIIKVPKNI